MARPQKQRRICSIPHVSLFAPVPPPSGATRRDGGTGRSEADGSPKDGSGADGSGADGPIVLTLDEYEVLRLVDHEGLTHGQCAAQMNISRTTASEICESARKKIADALVCGRGIRIEGGNWTLCEGNRDTCFLGACTRRD